MVLYPGTEKEARISAETMQNIVTDIFQRCGMDISDASQLADTLIDADLCGIHSHGVMRVPNYVKRMTKQGVDPRGKPSIVKDSGSVFVIDAGNNMGQISGTYAMRNTIERARTTGVAVAAVGGSNHCGAMYYYAQMAIEEDMIGVATTNALPTMAPWGGSERILGMNPIAVAIPAGEETPFILDTAFATSSFGKITVLGQKGVSLPEGWGIDKEGNPTTDPAKVLDGGMVLPIGGHKGSGMAMITGILSTLLSGAKYGTQLGNLEKGPTAGEDGHFFMALKIAAFETVSVFKHRMDEVIRDAKNSRKAPGIARIFIPGEMEAETKSTYLKTGIPLNAETLHGVVSTGSSLGADISSLEVHIDSLQNAANKSFKKPDPLT